MELLPVIVIAVVPMRLEHVPTTARADNVSTIMYAAVTDWVEFSATTTGSRLASRTKSEFATVRPSIDRSSEVPQQLWRVSFTLAARLFNQLERPGRLPTHRPAKVQAHRKRP